MVKFEYIIRPCQFEELHKVIAINEATLPENYPRFFYEQILQNWPNSFLVAELKNKKGFLIGYVMWRIERGASSFELKLVKKAHLVSIAVLEDYRRNKVATNLLEMSINEVKKYGIAECVLEVRISNKPAINLYQNHFGFKKIRIINRYYKDGEDAYFMSKKIE
ncbi:MAG: GNAT family N-acetyltransferase [Promethearchaeota archaeon]